MKHNAKIKGILWSIFLELKALENAFGGVSSKAAITNILHGGQDGSCVPAPAPRRLGMPSAPVWPLLRWGQGLPCCSAAWSRGHREGQARWAAFIQPLGQWRKGGDGPHTGGDFFPQEMDERSKCHPRGTSLVVQWLRRHASNTGDAGLIPGQGTKIPRALWCRQKLKNKKLKREKKMPHREKVIFRPRYAINSLCKKKLHGCCSKLGWWPQARICAQPSRSLPLGGHRFQSWKTRRRELYLPPASLFSLVLPLAHVLCR